MDKTLKLCMAVMIFGLFSFSVDAAVLSGKVVDDSNNEPIENANINVEKDGRGFLTTTLSDGGFSGFRIDDGRANIIISHVGYEPFVQLNVAFNGNVNLGIIKLRPKPYVVGEVQVVTNFETLTCNPLDLYPNAVNDLGDYHHYTSEDTRCGDVGVCYRYFDCKNIETFGTLSGECEFLDGRNSDIGFCVSHACDSDYLDCDGDSFGNDKNGCECRIDQGLETYGCVNRQCAKISEESLPAPSLGFGGQPIQPSTTVPATGIEPYELPDQIGLCPDISCPLGYQCRTIDGKCVKPENYDKQKCRIVTDYENIQDEEGISSNPIKGVEFWRKDINHIVVFEDKFYGNECIENENELSAADVSNRAREAYRNRETLRREAREKTGVTSMSVFEFMDEEREYGLINALMEASRKTGIEVEALTAAAFQENIGQWVDISQRYGSGDLSRRVVAVPNELALDYFFAEADTLKREGFLRDDFEEFVSIGGARGSFDNIDSAMEALGATLLYRRSLFFEDLKQFGIDKNTLTKDQIAYWTYIYFNCGANCGRGRIERYGIEIPKWVGSNSGQNTNRNSKLFLGIFYQIRNAGLFDSLNQVKVYYCENDELKFVIVNDKENLCSVLKEDTELIDTDWEDLPELELAELEKPELESDEEIIITMTGNELVKNAICSALPEGLEFVEESADAEPTATASVVKQITGFFSKITGKQASTTTDKKYTAKIITRTYHDLTNLQNPYLGAGFYSDDSATRIDRTAQARFLDKKLGSALIRSFGYTKNVLEPALSSAETQNEMATNRGYGYKHSIRILNRDNQLSKLKILDTQQGFNIEISDSEYEAMDIAVPDYNDFVKFLLVSTEEDRYFDVNGHVYSISAGYYLIPYPVDYNLLYTRLNTPEENPKLKPYYEIARKKKEITYNVVDKVLTIHLLTPSESYFLLNNVPNDFEKVRKSYKYKGNDLNYRIIALKEDYGDFKKGVYLAAEDYVVSMDNLYSLDKTAILRFLPARPGDEIVYNDRFFDLVRRYIEEHREATITDLLASLGRAIIDSVNLDPMRGR